ncbi:uncharacterized protein A4U43_C05F7590 [Asparagus officinalis]|uniref:VWFA domain-containing protein n=1 Tax=Asparagus officinalis TaxID=4686 RepID=A0A5P1EQM8_ASPOF|nr:uncharacterized protein A4U43_C05F7590 [Asparagus officinalis]
MSAHGSVTLAPSAEPTGPRSPAHPHRAPRCHLTTLQSPLRTKPPLLPSAVPLGLYDDDDPLDPSTLTSAASAPPLPLCPTPDNLSSRLYLSVKLAHQSPTDLVLLVSPNGPHLRLLKQAISLVVFTLCPTDRLAIVTYSATAATRAFPLRRMSPNGKRSALRVVDRLICLGPAGDPGPRDPSKGSGS